MNEHRPSKDQLSEQQIRNLLADAQFGIKGGRALDSLLVSAWALEQLCEAALAQRAAHEPLSGDALLKHLEAQCQAIWRTGFTIVCTLPKGHEGDHRADCGYTFNGEVDVRAAQPPSGWQPIETAPRGGKWLLLWWPDITDAPLVGYCNNKTEWHTATCAYAWQTSPTHWMPLPSPPPTKPACNCEGPQKIGPGYHAPYCATMAGTEFAKRYTPGETSETQRNPGKVTHDGN